MEKYKTGYVPGSFDLFHIGHLNLIRKAKERCEYLIAGVCTDELIEAYKGRKPYIRFEERIAIVEAIRYVDKAVRVDFSNADKIAAWQILRYDCHFAGSDHSSHWAVERKYLAEHGVSMEFFEYTQGISTTQLRDKIGE